MGGIKDFYRGDTRKYTVVVTSVDETGNEVPVSVHQGTLFVTFKSDSDAPDIDAAIQKSAIGTEPDPGNPTGRVSITLSAADTTVEPGSYFYDFQFVFVTGEVKTILPEPNASDDDKKVEIKTDVTRSVI